MDATVGPLKRLEALASQSRTEPLLELLRKASLAPNDIEIVGKLVSFLATPERIRILDGWCAESPLARELGRLGEAAWADAALLASIRPIGDAHLAGRQLHGKVQSHYLAAMAAARRANPFAHPTEAPFVERLRLVLMIRALEATAAGVPSDVHLDAVCASVRLAVDRDLHQGWGWLQRIAHIENVSFEDFIEATQVASERSLVRAVSGEERDFLRNLDAVLSKKRTAHKVHGVTTLSSGPSSSARSPSGVPQTSSKLEVAETGTVVAFSDASEQDLLFLVADVDPKRPPTAQRVAATGLILQTIEHAQFLRHSWHRLGLVEESAFFKRLGELRGGPDAQERLGSVLVGIAALACIPLSRLPELRIQSKLTDDWSIDLAAGCLRRRPPRPARRWRAGPESAGWVSPMADEWRIDLPEPTLSVVRSFRVRGGISAADLWDKVSPSRSIESWFVEQFAAGDALARLTSPIVGNILSQQLFEANRDHAQARLLSSTTRTALPSASIYGSFTGKEVAAVWGTAVHPALALLPPLGTLHRNAGGSELDINFRPLRKAIAQLTHRVDHAAAEPSEWVEHHNLLTALTIVSLLASTGARPVTSGFESLNWFDLERRLVYVEDKRSGPTQGSRLCVLSEPAHRLLVERYLPHLERLQQALASRMPKFAEQLSKLRQGDSDCKVPLFFFLRAKPDFDWIEVSETQLAIVCDNPWPLPWNLFRHLHSTQLRRRGLPADVRDALLSHGERGAESHGEFSWRIPCDDLELATPLVDAIAKELGFVLPRPGVAAQLGPGRWTDMDSSQAPLFGRQARQDRRDKVHDAARRNARAEIERRLGQRPPSSLSSDDWDEIARRMILRDDGMPHSQASLRYEMLEDFMSELWRRERVRIPMRRRYIPLGEGRAWFNEDAINAPRRLAELRTALDAGDLERKPGPDIAGCLAALELALHCRVSNFTVLSAVARNQESIELIRFQGRFWLECAYENMWQDGRPVYRIAITERAAGWIGVRRDGSQRLKTMPSVPTALKGFGGLATTSTEGLLRKLCHLIAQVNALELPGAMAAMVHGSRESSALPHSDWVRTSCLQAPVLDSVEPEGIALEQEPADPAELFRHHNRLPTAETDDELTRCIALFESIQQVLSEDGRAAKHMAAEVQRLVKQSGFEKGSAPYVLSHYVHHLLTRPKKGRTTKGLKPSTALRYWYALKSGVLEFAFDSYLPSLDEEELTSLYQQIVDAAELPALAPKASTSGPVRRHRKLRSDTDAGRRSLTELRSFHEFARDIYGMDDPDWSEISPGIAAGSGRPGIVLMAEYRAMLSTLASNTSCRAADDATLASAFVLIACARFGLRVAEAVGLYRSDWVEVAGSTVVLVRSNATRGLKTEVTSKRQVPLLGRFDPVERAVVDEVCRRWVLRSLPQASTALLPGVEPATFKLHKSRIEKRLLQLVKSVTGNPTSVLHHLRHGFACRLLVLLHGRPYGLGLPCDHDDTSATRRLLLQGDEPDRRTLWAVARMLGHSSPAASIKSYLHLLDFWLPEPPHRPAPFELHLAARVIDLDRTAKHDRIAALEPLPADEVPSPHPLFGRYVQYMRLEAIGHRQASELAQLSQPEKRCLDAALSAVATKLRQDGPSPAAQLIAKVPERRWRALVAMTDASRSVPPPVAAATWLPTVGANGQVVLFLGVHFEWVSAFLQGLGLGEYDCTLIHNNKAEPTLLRQASDARLHRLLLPSEKYGEWFQLDKAEEESPRRTYTDRIAMLPKKGGKLATSRELLLLWAAWLVAGYQDTPTA